MIEYLSKSTILAYESCPLSFYYSKIEKRTPLPNPYFERGSIVHEAIKNYYDTGAVYVGEHQKYFDNFMLFDKMVGMPEIWETKFRSEEHKLTGIIDAYFSGGVLLDFKTSDYKPGAVDDYRFELSLYKLLLDANDLPVEKVGISFLKSGHVWWEKPILGPEAVLKRADEVRQGVACGDFAPKENRWCFNCGFRDICELNKSKR